MVFNAVICYVGTFGVVYWGVDCKDVHCDNDNTDHDADECLHAPEGKAKENKLIVLCSFCLVFCNVCSPQISSFKVRAEEIWPIP